ncbi:MAG: tail fiber domain-containing protein [Bacteroidota bacterium]|nr:tail fiber domain-containing protein [Bacteroidota bacterium]
MGSIKKMIVSIIIVTMFMSVNAQINVGSNGNVGIGSSNPQSKLSVNADGSSLYGAYIKNLTPANGAVGLFSTTAVKDTAINTGYCYKSVWAPITSGDGYTFGLYGQSLSSIPVSKGRSFGVYGVAANATSGYNYGVLGALSGTANGAAIFGTTSTNAWGEAVSGRYAGCFVGDTYINGKLGLGIAPTTYALDVNGVVRATSFLQSSDNRLKENVTDLKDCLPTLRQLRSVSYNLKAPQNSSLKNFIKSSGDTIAETSALKVDSALYSKKHIGFIAQEVQQLYPQLIQVDKDSLLAIDYIGLIPIIVEALKEQDSIICELNQEIKSLRSSLNKISSKQDAPIALSDNVALTKKAVKFLPLPGLRNKNKNLTLCDEKKEVRQ